MKGGVSTISFVIRKHAPELLLGGGIVGIIGSTVMFTKAAPEVHAHVANASEDLASIDESHEQTPDMYTAESAKNDKKWILRSTSKQVLRLYGPPVTLGVLSIGAILTSHGIMKRRNLALVAAYKGVEQAFKKYRLRVIEDHGEQYDRDVRHGVRRKTIEEEVTTPKGKKTKVSKEVAEKDPAAATSFYGRYFTHGSRFFKGEFSLDLMYLRMRESELNSLLELNGHVFLNEAYDMLDMPRTEAGSIMGWRKNTKTGDGYISFGVFNRMTGQMCDWVDDPVYHDAIPVDFNVDDGPIFDKIENKQLVRELSLDAPAIIH